MAAAVSHVSMANEHGRNLYSFFPSRNSKMDHAISAFKYKKLIIPPGLSQGLTKTDGPTGSRKRQRTSSPKGEPNSSIDVGTITSSNEWEIQLRTAAYGQDQLAESESQPGLAIEFMGDVSATAVDKYAGGAGTVYYLQEDDELKTRLAGLRSETASKFMDALRPPQKMLTIRSDGKLRSPKPQSINSNLNRKQRNNKAESNIKEKILILRYGATEESRCFTGRKIQEIISKVPLGSIPHANATQFFYKPVVPPKNTHPFFLGASHGSIKTAPIQNNVLKEAIKESNAPTQRQESNSPGKRKLPKCSSINENAWSTMSAFEGRRSDLEKSQVTRFPGVMEPIWPPREMTHIRPSAENIVRSHFKSETSCMPSERRKMKYPKVQIAEKDEILRPYIYLASMERHLAETAAQSSTHTFRRPHRMVMTGLQMQNEVRKNIVSNLPQTSKPKEVIKREEDELSSSHKSPRAIHGALTRIYKDIPVSLTAFDKFECETQDWAHKYAPHRAEEVLQPGREALVLRDWLRSLTVSSVESGDGDALKSKDASSGKIDCKFKHKKRKRAEDLDGFLISSDEEPNEMGELLNFRGYEGGSDKHTSSKRSVIRTENGSTHSIHGQRFANAIVISGPHGCGKTAAVYAAAQELGFEVFEVNAGSRRSGKDVLDKVGDMSRNHLVNHAHEREEMQGIELFEPSEALKQELESGRQATVNSFFLPKEKTKKKPRGRPRGGGSGLRIPMKTKKAAQSQKQSLILLEEVDVLFEEDKQFWATILDLTLTSKRPIIMTCTDEDLLPLDEMLLHAILRFTAPPQELAVDYLLLVACNEGHLLSRSAISLLWHSKNFDLRASIMELNFFCQMALGDVKGGLGWMLIRSSIEESQSRKGEMRRVVSVGTYHDGMGLLGYEPQDCDAETIFKNGTGLLSQIRDCWDTDIKDPQSFHVANSQINIKPESKEISLEDLIALDQALDAMSAGDTFSGSETWNGNKVSRKRRFFAYHANSGSRCWTQLCLRFRRNQEPISLTVRFYSKRIR